MNGGPNPAPTAPDRVLTGLAAAPGIAAGPAHVMEAGTLRVAEYRIPAAKVEAERKRFADAVAASARQTRKLQKKAASLSGAGAEELGYLLEAGLQMLSDSRLIRGVDERIVASGINAEAAVQAEIRHISQAFAALPDPYLAGRVQDIRDVGVRLVRNLTHTPYRGFSDLPRNSIIIADEITPADTALMEPNRIAGFASALGGPESHTAIMARSLGLPAVLGIPGLTGMIQPGEQVILDGSSGQITLRPSAAALARYARQRHALRRERRLLARLRDLAAVTKDGVRVQLQANVELPIELETALRVGAEGIGLLRTEFLFMNRDDVPGEDEQAQALRAFVEAMEGKPVTIRTLDVGGDKLSGSLGEAAGGGVNPALGLRAIRLSLKVRSLMENQLAAILRAGAYGPVRILLPMVTTPDEVLTVRAELRNALRRLRRRKVRVADPLPEVGAMIEVPAAAIAARAIAAVSDFVSLGTNDLTMYTLAVDRGDENVASLYDPLHPAVLRLIRMTIEAAEKAGIPVGLCGEMAGDARYTPLLLGLGLRDLSMPAVGLPRVKRRVRAIDMAKATRGAHLILEQPDSKRISALLDCLGT